MAKEMKQKSSLPPFIAGMVAAAVLIHLGIYAKETLAYAQGFAHKGGRDAQIERLLAEAGD